MEVITEEVQAAIQVEVTAAIAQAVEMMANGAPVAAEAASVQAPVGEFMVMREVKAVVAALLGTNRSATQTVAIN